MKNYQFFILTALIIGLGAYLYLGKKKKCSCTESIDTTSADEIES